MIVVPDRLQQQIFIRGPEALIYCYKTLVGLLISSLFVRAASAVITTEFTVDGSDNIWLASATGTGGGGVPPQVNFTPGSGSTFEFLSVSGLTTCCGGAPFIGADGQGGNTGISSSGGISGLTAARQLFLAGVFTGSSNPPSGTAPATINFHTVGVGFLSLSPESNQIFFIGDGLTGTGSGQIQKFLAPQDADMLYLGFGDAFGFSGNPGTYTDNFGSVSGTILLIPESNATLLVVVVAGLVIVFGRHISGKRKGLGSGRDWTTRPARGSFRTYF